MENATGGKIEMHFVFFVDIHSEKVKLILVFVFILVALEAGVETSTSGPVLSSGPPLGAVRLAQERSSSDSRGDNNNSNRLIFIH